MASSSSPSYSKTLLDNCPSVLVSNDLMQLIKDPEQKEESFAHLTTMEELLLQMKNYIMKHKLYDPNNPSKICVRENELGSLLGKSEFSILDVRDILLQKCVFPVAQKNSSEVICSISDKISKKRKLCVGESASEFSKKAKGLDASYDSDESIHSIQDYETEFVQDSTSDDNFSVDGLIFAEAYDVDVEIETDNSDFSCESDTDIEDIVKSAIITFIAQSSDSDVEYLADGSSDETSEKELSEEDKWCCSSCLMLNNPLTRRCAFCWRTRIGWLSERDEKDTSKRKRLSRSKRKLKKNRDSSNRSLSDLPSAIKESFASPSSSCNDNTDSANQKFSDLCVATTESLNSPSSSQNSNTDAACSPSNISEADDGCTKSESDKQCLFCCARPADSSIIHGRVGCKVCCFKCGQKLLARNKRCPVCRRNIERIVYLYNS